MLVHLDKNKLTLAHTPQKDLYNMILAVADHRIASESSSAQKRRQRRTPPRDERPDTDKEVAALAAWIRKRSVKPQRFERQVTYRELRRILRRFDYDLRTGGGAKGNTADVVRLERKMVGVFRKSEKIIEKRVGSVGYKDEGTAVSIKDLKLVRKMCKLTEDDGCDSAAFYDSEAVIESFVNHYRTILRRLARK